MVVAVTIIALIGIFHHVLAIEPSSPSVNTSCFSGHVVDFCNAAGGVSVIENRIFKNLPTTLPADNWVAEFEYKFTASNIPTFIIFALTPSNNDPQDQPNEIIITHGDFAGDNQLSA